MLLRRREPVAPATAAEERRAGAPRPRLEPPSPAVSLSHPQREDNGRVSPSTNCRDDRRATRSVQLGGRARLYERRFGGAHVKMMLAVWTDLGLVEEASGHGPLPGFSAVVVRLLDRLLAAAVVASGGRRSGE